MNRTKVQYKNNLNEFKKDTVFEAYMLVLEKEDEKNSGAYKKVFNDLAKKHGFEPEAVNTLSPEKKKAFFDELDSKWKAPGEKKEKNENVNELEGK